MKKLPLKIRLAWPRGYYALLLTAATTLFFNCSDNKREQSFDPTTIFDTSDGKRTPRYNDVIQWYKGLSDAYTSVALYEMGPTDSGEPLHLLTFNPNRSFESEFSGSRDKAILLINNGIHPGEPDGIDACMQLFRDLATGVIPAPPNLVVAAIPVYNVGGALNRNRYSRANQNGPEEYGFRGNARNFDLNRDFIKADTRNARSFSRLFRTVDPDFFVDTHVSNGADYQYTLTHLFTQHNKLGGALGAFLQDTFRPALEDSLEQNGWPITPYVNVYNRSPRNGFGQFFDGGRYSTGYAALYNTLGMMVETHMLKPYKERVKGTYTILKEFVELASATADTVRALRVARVRDLKAGKPYAIRWKLDSSHTRTLEFKGYAESYQTSPLTGARQLKYDREQPESYQLPYYDTFTASASVTIPDYYLVPQGYWPVIERLRANRVRYERLAKDSTFTATVYHIKDYETVKNPYEGHYLHYNTKVDARQEEVDMREGDYLVRTDQPALRYLLETLEPAAPDSFFNWNFFDTILRQKEGFSPYVWDHKAMEYLQEQPRLKAAFDSLKASDPAFRANWYAQLDWIYKRSPHYEEAHLRYPVVRVGG